MIKEEANAIVETFITQPNEKLVKTNTVKTNTVKAAQMVKLQRA